MVRQIVEASPWDTACGACHSPWTSTRLIWLPMLGIQLRIGEATMTGAAHRNLTTFSVARRGWLTALMVAIPLTASPAELWVDRNSLGGAYEYASTATLFADGFESGDTDKWSTTDP